MIRKTNDFFISMDPSKIAKQFLTTSEVVYFKVPKALEGMILSLLKYAL